MEPGRDDDHPAATAEVELTAGSPWEYRAVVEGSPRPWTTSLAEALAGLASARRAVDWPREWVAFGVVEAKGPFRPVSDPRSGEVPPREVLASVPAALSLDGRELRKAVVSADDRGAVDLVPVFGKPRNGRTAYLFAEVELASGLEVLAHAGADWWMQWWVDGEHAFDTLSGANRSPLLGRAHEFALAAGRHVLAVRVLSGNGGWGLATEATVAAGPSLEAGAAVRVEARRVFDVRDPDEFRSLTFVGPEEGRPLLNGAEIPVPNGCMRYRTVYGVPVSILRPGANELVKSWSEDESARGARVMGVTLFRASGPDARLLPEGRLYGLVPDAARVRTGPVLGCVGTDFFTVSCRTNMPVGVTLKAGGKELVSEPGLLHRFRAEGLEPGTEHAYTVRPLGLSPGPERERTRSGALRTLPASGRFTFCVLGDSASAPEDWAAVAKAVAAERPAFAVFTGDMVPRGLSDTVWDEDFFGRAPDLFAHVPFYPVAGNHEQRCELFDRIFVTPGEGRNWSQELGRVLLVGIDGEADWSPGSERASRLDETLAGSRAAFVFVFCHYPPWSSGVHGRLGRRGDRDAEGEPVEPQVRQAREHVVPVLARHGVTALFSGHDHLYERSELPGGVTAITTGGAGSYLYPRREDARQNPHSRAFAMKFHYCLVTVADEACALRALDLDGSEIDARTWEPR
jgi:hypothetical protein